MGLKDTARAICSTFLDAVKRKKGCDQALGDLGYYSYHTHLLKEIGEYAQAKQVQEECVSLMRRRFENESTHITRREYLIALFDLGVIDSFLGNKDELIESSNRSLRVLKSIPDSEEKQIETGDYYYHFAICAVIIQDVEKAVELLRKAQKYPSFENGNGGLSSIQWYLSVMEKNGISTVGVRQRLRIEGWET